MKQTGLVYHVNIVVVLDGGVAKGKYTPAGYVPLFNNEDCIPVSGCFNCSIVVGILIYLSVHTRPDIAFSVNCCARYMFCPNNFHGKALKRIGRYLKLTRYFGLILNPNR